MTNTMEMAEKLAVE